MSIKAETAASKEEKYTQETCKLRLAAGRMQERIVGRVLVFFKEPCVCGRGGGRGKEGEEGEGEVESVGRRS